jgi:hypothetical protein
MIKTLKQLKKFFIGLIGGTVVLIGVVMIALPGPAIIIIPFGLSILATEFIWAKKISDKLQARVQRVKNNIKEFRLTSEK